MAHAFHCWTSTNVFAVTGTKAETAKTKLMLKCSAMADPLNLMETITTPTGVAAVEGELLN